MLLNFAVKAFTIVYTRVRAKRKCRHLRTGSKKVFHVLFDLFLQNENVETDIIYDEGVTGISTSISLKINRPIIAGQTQSISYQIMFEEDTTPLQPKYRS